MIGSILGPYRVLEKLGEGGMGEVYRARDTNLDRDVALKVLPDAFSNDPDRVARFEREAKTLAALNHPHIAHVYGFEGGSPFDSAHGKPTQPRVLVMELVEGEDLAARIGRGPIPIDEAVPIARQIAEALEAAHEVGIIHRDLKPANIKVRSDGTVKVLDFGLARTEGAGVSPDKSPTITTPAMMTAAGMILGTAGYMSPEQARGKTVDKRADIWAFGVMLFEMLTGTVTFPGESVADVISAVISREPDWAALPSGLPIRLRDLLQRCLEKDPRLRLRDIGEARVVLNDPGRAVSPDDRRLAVQGQSIAMRWLPWAVASLAIVAAVAAWMVKPVAPAGPVRKLELALPGDGRNFTLSPDGKRIAFFSKTGVATIDLERLETRELAQFAPSQRTELVWSPDSAFIGYNDASAKFWIVPSSGGTPRLVCSIPESGQLMGITWDASGSITFAVWRGNLYRVAASGGTPAPLVTIDPQKEIDYHELIALPDGRVMALLHLVDANNAYRVEVIGDGRKEVLGTGFRPVGYVDRGYVLMDRFDVNAGTWAFPFSGRLPLRVEEGFLVAPGSDRPSASKEGSLLYSLASSALQTRELVWVDRVGQTAGPIGSEQIELTGPTLSPDGRRIAFAAHIGDSQDLLVRDLQTGAQTRVTSDAADQGSAAWLPDGVRLTYWEVGGVGTDRIVAANADGSGRRREIAKGSNPTLSHDGRYMVYVVDERGNYHVRYAALSADGTPGPEARLFKSDPEPSVHALSLSPDSRFLAYVERERSGNMEVFVTGFPSGEGRWQISSGGGRNPIWARNGELFYAAGSTDGPKTMMAVAIRASQTLTLETPIKLFAIDGETLVGARNSFDVTADGKRFVMVRSRPSTGQAAVRWILVQNWQSEFAAR